VNVKTGSDSSGLPNPVYRYFKHVLAENQHPIRVMRMTQSGKLRTDVHRERWMKFRADHVVRPYSRSFAWDARLRILPLVHVRVSDAYADGVGSGQVQLLSALTVACDSNKPELNSASLHRYLAEAVWYPTALLPSAGVQWSPIDNRRAFATLSDLGNTVSLEFRFNDAAEVVGIYTEGRWSRTANGYELTPWEGHFSDYRCHKGVLVPSSGEVGWYANGHLEIVWTGEITSLEYEFERVEG
jgi:hypothetical protein